MVADVGDDGGSGMDAIRTGAAEVAGMAADVAATSLAVARVAGKTVGGIASSMGTVAMRAVRLPYKFVQKRQDRLMDDKRKEELVKRKGFQVKAKELQERKEALKWPAMKYAKSKK